jgi:ABC-type transport system involved in multi-copper enzyme maturation permease subunit
VTTTDARPGAARQAPAADGVSFARVLRSEWLRFRSLRSTWITLAVTVVFVIGLGALFTAARAAHWPPRDPGEALTFDPTQASLGGTFLAQLATGVLGVLLVTGEYATGMVRATFTAVPRRLSVLVGRTVVFAVVTAVVLLPTCVVAFVLGQHLLSSAHIQTTFSAPGVTRAVVGAGLYLVAIGLLGVALGWLLRHTAGAIAVLVGVLLIVPILVHLLPDPWPDRISKWLPGQAGQALWAVRHDPTMLAPWSGFGILMLYVVAALIAAALLLTRRDV